MYRQRDIILIPFPNSDLTGAKQRPALIISNSQSNSRDYICCFVTSNPAAQGLQLSKRSLAKGTLPFTSVVKPNKLFTVEDRLIKSRLCVVTESFHELVIAELEKYLVLENRSVE